MQETRQAAGLDQMNNPLKPNKAKPSGLAAERPSGDSVPRSTRRLVSLAPVIFIHSFVIVSIKKTG